MSSFAIHGKWVLAHQGAEPALVEDRYVIVEGAKIAAVTDRLPERVDHLIAPEQAMILPGFINLHNHLTTAVLTRGLTEDVTAEAYASTLIYDILMPVADVAVSHLSSEEMRAVVDLGMLEVIKGGTTTLLDIFRSSQVENFESALQMGLRFYGAPYIFADKGLAPGVSSRPSGLDLWHQHHRRYQGGGDGRVQLVLSPHGVDTCDPALLRAVRSAADELGLPITTHLAQSEQEVRDVKARHGKSPVALLDDLGLLGPDLLAAHCIFADEDDLALLQGSDSVVINCPMTFARGGVFAPFGRFAQHGIRTAVGTDGYIMDMTNELRMAGLISKLESGQSDRATAWQLFTAATSGAAAVLGRRDIGRIAPGAKADLLVVGMKAPHLQPVADPLTNFIWYGSGRDITDVVVDGQILQRQGRLLVGDEQDIIARGAAATAKVWRIAGKLYPQVPRIGSGLAQGPPGPDPS